MQVYQDMGKLDPRHSKAHSGLGAAYYSMGRLPDAEAAFKKAIESGPNDPYPFEMLGNLANKALCPTGCDELRPYRIGGRAKDKEGAETGYLAGLQATQVVSSSIHSAVLAGGKNI